jgi:hypothetical protein
MEIKDGLYGAELQHASIRRQTVAFPKDDVPFYFISPNGDETIQLNTNAWLMTDLSQPDQHPACQNHGITHVISKHETEEAKPLKHSEQEALTEAQRAELEELAEVLSQPLYPQEIMAKINLAFTAGTVFHDRAAQVRILLSAFQDTESMIGEALYKTWGKRPNEATLHIIGSLRGIQGRILGHIRNTTSVGLNDDELRALLETDQARSHHPGNLLAQASELVYGSRSNPSQYRANASSANAKIDREIRRLTFRIEQALNTIENNPSQRLDILKQVSPWVEQGKAFAEIHKASHWNGSQNYDSHHEFDAVCNHFHSLKSG